MGEREVKAPELAGERPGAVDRVVSAMVARSVRGDCCRADLRDAVASEHLPARLYADVVRELAQRGVTIVDGSPVPRAADGPAPDAAADDTSDQPSGDPGWNADGFEHHNASHRHRLLTFEEERELGVRIQRGLLASGALAKAIDQGVELPVEARRSFERRARDGQRAQDELTVHNLRLVLKIAHRYRANATPGLSLEDMYQEGVIGLAHAVIKFDPDRGLKFSTYGTWWIRQAITRAIADKSRSVRLPVHMVESLNTLRATRQRMIQELGRTPTVEELAAVCCMSVREIRKRLPLLDPVTSLDAPVRRGQGIQANQISDPFADDPAEIAVEHELARALGNALGILTDREREIMIRRFGLADGRVRTLEEIGQEYGVTRERIRQIEEKSIKKLRGSRHASALAEFVTFRAKAEPAPPSPKRKPIGQPHYRRSA